MAWRDILVFADGSPSGLARARMAGDIATRFASGRLTLCVPAILPMQPYGVGAATLERIYDEAVQFAVDEAAAAAKAASEALKPAVGDMRVLSPLWRLPEIEAEAAALARAFDAIVLAQPIRADQSPLDDLLLNGVLFGSGRPVFVIPRWEAQRPIGRRVLAAWSDTREATRAIHDSKPLLASADAVRLLHIEGEGDQSAREKERFDAMCAHLQAMPLKSFSSHIVVLDDGPPLTLSGAADAFKADLVVMGGYGHTRLRQFILGGMTRTMLHQSQVALFLSH